ncbi:hypothetical protein [Actinomadura sp. GTD37]|uniref:hypothetical protein n=1 Tax=Actinomadura sp. GTD37 TaxID=1778030 RepID=UPI0035C16909
MTTSTFVSVKPRSLEPGDVFADGDEITEVYRDRDGVWIETERGDSGYLDDRVRYRIYRR